MSNVSQHGLQTVSFPEGGFERDRPSATRFDGADLTGAILTRARLSGATYDERTVLPRGFKPDKARMIPRIGNRKPRASKA